MVSRAETKERLMNNILLAAKELFTEHDFNDVTIKMIAQKAKVGLGITYNYFDSKEVLFLVVMAEESVKFETRKSLSECQNISELIENY